ncbi:nuclear transport factor 2 family protein [Maribacter sp. CXY002]|uniref:nuclear transport factor 2 family protein n=1 Tax=Maribacter luteocoastalis TaxID=3407671 RepID=UPI003B66DD89
MKNPLLLLAIFTITYGIGQTEEDRNVKNTVISFFDAFHAKDEQGMKKIVSPEVVLQTIGVDREGKQVLRTEHFDDLINSIISIPDSVNFQEKIINYSIQIDGAMANAWTPYEFWLNDKFHHCGVNSFQLFKEEGIWKIIYLIDTRRKQGCQNSPE